MASNGRLAWLVIGVVSTVTAISAASSGMWYLTGFRPSLHNQTYTETYAGNPGALSVKLSSGDIRIQQGPAGHVEIARDLSWTKARPSVSEHWNGHELDITANCPSSGFGENCSVNYTIAVPPGVSVNAITGSGRVTATGMDGRLDLTTYSGDINVTGAQSAEVIASTDAGNVNLAFATAPDSVQASTDAGDVNIAVPPGEKYDVRPTANSGNTSIAVNDDPAAPRSIVVTSAAGNVMVVYN